MVQIKGTEWQTKNYTTLHRKLNIRAAQTLLKLGVNTGATEVLVVPALQNVVFIWSRFNISYYARRHNKNHVLRGYHTLQGENSLEISWTFLIIWCLYADFKHLGDQNHREKSCYVASECIALSPLVGIC